MKFETTKCSDSKGFWLRSKPITISFNYWKIWRYQKRNLLGWLFNVSFGKGAGYIDGANIFIGWNTRGGIPNNPHGPWPKFRIGFTSPYHFRQFK